MPVWKRLEMENRGAQLGEKDHVLSMSRAWAGGVRLKSGAHVDVGSKDTVG